MALPAAPAAFRKEDLWAERAAVRALAGPARSPALTWPALTCGADLAGADLAALTWPALTWPALTWPALTWPALTWPAPAWPAVCPRLSTTGRLDRT